MGLLTVVRDADFTATNAVDTYDCTDPQSVQQTQADMAQYRGFLASVAIDETILYAGGRYQPPRAVRLSFFTLVSATIYTLDTLSATPPHLVVVLPGMPQLSVHVTGMVGFPIADQIALFAGGTNSLVEQAPGYLHSFSYTRLNRTLGTKSRHTWWMGMGTCTRTSCMSKSRLQLAPVYLRKVIGLDSSLVVSYRIRVPQFLAPKPLT